MSGKNFSQPFLAMSFDSDWFLTANFRANREVVARVGENKSGKRTPGTLSDDAFRALLINAFIASSVNLRVSSNLESGVGKR